MPFFFSNLTSGSSVSLMVCDDANPVFACLQETVKQGASDLFVSVGEPPVLKIFGVFKRLSVQIPDHDTLQGFIKSILPFNKSRQFASGREIDLGVDIKELGRFRINIFRHQRGLSMAVRPLPRSIPTLDELELPGVFHSLTGLKHGLVLITGPAGSGKTTTLASFIETVNQREQKHVITIEDPIEYLIANKRCLIHQREVGEHTASFADGLRNALRESPDIIVVGEMRDLETIALALRAAETGHLVLGTLHSATAVQAITRIIDAFDSIRQKQVTIQLAQSLQCVCAQNLFKRRDRGGMVLTTEVLIGTLAISNLIRQDRIHEIHGYMETGIAENMHTFKQSIQSLMDTGMIEKQELSSVQKNLNDRW